MSKLSLPKDKIRVLLLENIHDNALKVFEAQGYGNIEKQDAALDAEDLKKAIADAHMVGIRSRTRLTEDVLAAADKLMAIGCFCIGTNQVDLQAAKLRGVPVFNAPYSNTRSVAELVIGEVVMLFRGILEKSMQAHRGLWNKAAKGSHEVRGKTLGIVGYGHIGSQVSVLAESIGMQVRYFDIVEKLPLGNAKPCSTLEELLEVSDVVTLHVPQTPQTRNIMTAREFDMMKPGAHFINLARGHCVVIEDLVSALESKRIGGAAIDVFPKEPASLEEEFVSPLRGHENVILSPHIGGSTQEAQANIGIEVGERLVKYSDNGSTLGAVNFPELALPVQEGATRYMHIHRNVPGVLSAINDVFSGRDLNITGQFLRTDGDVGYVVVDVEGDVKAGMGTRQGLQDIPGTVRTRVLM